MKKGPINKEPQSMNFSKAFPEINKIINSPIGNTATENKTNIDLLLSLLTTHQIILLSLARNSTQQNPWLKLVQTVKHQTQSILRFQLPRKKW